jgi:hypothetical protein
MATRGSPRFTVDVDLLTIDPRVLEPAVWVDVEAGGAAGVAIAPVGAPARGPQVTGQPVT